MKTIDKNSCFFLFFLTILQINYLYNGFTLHIATKIAQIKQKPPSILIFNVRFCFMIVFPNAKINLGLNIVSKREDGYHNLETVFFPIPIFDALEVLEDASLSSSYSFSSSGIKVDGNSESNLCIKAYNLLKSDFNLNPIKVHLHKTIPMGGGLGGGSSDASFMLKALDSLFELNIPESQLLDYAKRLGADCSFFIKNTPCFATGIGDVLTPINLSLSGVYFVLLNPKIHVSTAEAFAGIKPKSPTLSVNDIVLSSPQKWKNILVNDFEESVFSAHPQIQEFKNSLYSDGAFYASMSGSGSSVYALFTEKPATITLENYIVWHGKL